MVYAKREEKVKRPKKDENSSFVRRKRCKFCAAKQTKIDYKDINRLMQFLNERGRIVSRRMSGNCSKHQRKLAEAIKISRFLALLSSK